MATLTDLQKTKEVYEHLYKNRFNRKTAILDVGVIYFTTETVRVSSNCYH